MADRTQSPLALWADLRRFTPARVALGRAGNGLPTGAHLAFQAAHAAARDAVHAALDLAALRGALTAVGIDSVSVHSQAADRQAYLLRPDLGRRLCATDRPLLTPQPGAFAFVVCDGLSATAVAHHAAGVLALAIPALRAAGHTVAPVVLAEQGRVALGDDIGEALGAAAVAVLIGERPGLSAADSLGIYLTWQPRRGRTDAERNCISNVRPEGFPPAAAVDKLLWLIGAMRRLRMTGVGLKDEQTAALRYNGPRQDTPPLDALPNAALPRDAPPRDALADAALPPDAQPHDAVPHDAVPDAALPHQALPDAAVQD